MTEWVELHAASAFSFLEGASTPEELAREAARLGYPALALVDRDGLYGAPRFHRACREAGLRALLGAEVTLEGGGRLGLLVENRNGYTHLCRLITRMKLRAGQGHAAARIEEVEEFSPGLLCLAGGVRGPLRSRLLRQGEEAARALLERLCALFPGRLYLELVRDGDRAQEAANQQWIAWSQRYQIPLLASNDVRYAQQRDRVLLDVLTCIRQHTTLERAGRRLEPNSERHLKSRRQMARLFADLPGALERTREVAGRIDFTLENLGYRFPEYPLPAGETAAGYLRRLTEAGARRRYRPYHRRARRQVARELDLIERLDLAGYFLIVWDIVRYCRQHDILVQGRGSAANSAVCYSLGITAVDPVGMDLLFERFLSEERGEWPDIDLDLPSGERREQVLQYVYRRYGERGAALTANVITYRARSAAREVGKVLGFSRETLDRLSRLLGAGRGVDWKEALPGRLREAGLDPSHARVRQLAHLWEKIQHLPRHLGQHPGGMVIARGRLDTVVPLEPAAMAGRRVIQWDKEDCADLGIVKVDLLGLGMMAVLEDSIRLLRQAGRRVDLAHLPPDDPAVYRMLGRADTVGLFQVESRAQMATLPRLRPRSFYDLVVEIAIIRPGPIVGQMVHPYLKRRAGLEPVTYPHPSLKPILERTLGVPLFQEQLLRIAMTAAGFSGGEAEELRRAMGFRRSQERMEEIEKKLSRGLERNGIRGEAARTIVRYIRSFALYGFPESHAASFALLAYASAYLKAHHGAAFYAALLNNQPMGFYHPATLVQDARRHGQRILPVDVLASQWKCTLEGEAVRLGLCYVKGLREKAGRRIPIERQRRGFDSLEELVHRCRLRQEEVRTLARIGALSGFGLGRREALWQVEATGRGAGALLERAGPLEEEGSPLPQMNPLERLVADFEGTGLTLGPHPMALLRARLTRRGVVACGRLPALGERRPVRVAGGVIARQRPGTARGFLFLSLEDETGIANIVVDPDLFERERALLLSKSFLLIEGRLENRNRHTSVRARRLWALEGLSLELSARNFC